MRLDSVAVGERTVRARVRLPREAPLRTSAYPGFAPRLIAALPGLRRHACRNGTHADEGTHADDEWHAGYGARAGARDEFADTEVAHVLEHVVLELMALAGAPRTLEGTTRWDFVRDDRGVFELEIAYRDGRLAVDALHGALRVVDGLLAGGTVAEADRVADAFRARGERDVTDGSRLSGRACRAGSGGATVRESSTRDAGAHTTRTARP